MLIRMNVTVGLSARSKIDKIECKSGGIRSKETASDQRERVALE